jgi:hypothetical protein
MKKPTDHFTTVYPFAHWIKNRARYPWGFVEPSRPLAYATLLLLSAKRGAETTEALRHWVQDYRAKHPIAFEGTLVRMFSKAWRQNTRSEVLFVNSNPLSQAALLILAYFELASGNSTWSHFHSVYEELSPHDRDLAFHELRSWSGLELFYKEVELALLGRQEEVSWLKKQNGLPQVKGLYLRQVQALLVGDAMSFNADRRMLALSTLHDKVRALIAHWAFDLGKKSFSVIEDADCVTVKRTR